MSPLDAITDGAEVTAPRQLTTVYGPLWVPADDNDIIVRFLESQGQWALLEARLVARALPEVTRLLDGGAFVGTFSLGLALTRPLEFVCAVEANPLAAALLQRNLDRNLTGQIVVRAAVLTPARAGELTGRFSKGNMGGLSFTNGARGDQLVYQPDCISLVELWHNNGPFDLIKLDIEGMERAVLDDARQLLEVEQQVAIWAECNDSPHSLDLAELMLSFGGRSLYYASWPADNLGSLGDSGEPIFPYAREAALLAANRAVAPNDELIAAGCDMVQISSRESLRRAMWLTPRWAPRKWWTDKTTALVAQAVHDLSGESYETYLSGTAGAGGSAVLTREQLEARLEAAEALSKERLAAFADLQQELVDLQASLSDLERVAAERLAEAEINRQRAKRAERSLANIRLQAPRNQQ